MATILVVEDELQDLFRLSLALLNGGTHMVETAETGYEAVRKTKALKPKLIIMDMKLPQMGGLKAIERIREFDKEVPILAITAYDFTRQDALAAGANDFMRKPFDIEELCSKVSWLLSRGDS